MTTILNKNLILFKELQTPSFNLMPSNLVDGKDLVKISAICSYVL